MITAGSKLGPYEILSALGAGGMGEVYRARDTRLGRDVAIKVLPESFSSDRDRVRRFEQEARTVAALNHPNILAIFDIGTQDQTSYLVSELLEGESLRDRLRAGALSPRRAGEYALQLAHGLAAAHSKGVVHRDLKPENIFITRENRLKVLDFGLAKLQPMGLAAAASEQTAASGELGTSPGVVLGTVGYMAPEQVRGEPADHRSDIFAFGAILYEMLSGQRAFKRDTSAETLTAILKEDPPELESASGQQIPPAMDRIVRRCLEKQPGLRFQSASDLGFAIEALSAASGASAALGMKTAPAKINLKMWAGYASTAVAIIAMFYMAGGKRATAAAPTFRRLTYTREDIPSARFASDGQTIFFTAVRGAGDAHIYATTPGFPESRALEMPAAMLWSVSAKGEMAVCLGGGSLRAHDVCRGTLARVPSAGGAPREILENVEGADWSPDGSKLAIVHAVGGGEQIEYPIGNVLYKTSGWVTHLRFSPDGKWLAFLSHPFWPDDRGNVAVVEASGGNAKVLTTDFPSLEGLAWSAGGDEIWFSAAEQGSNQGILAVTLAGKQRPIARIPGNVWLYDVARDGRVVLSRQETSLGVRAVLAGAAQETDYFWFDYSLGADISRDGKMLLFGEEGDGGGPLYMAAVRRAGEPSSVRLGDGTPSSFSPDMKTVSSMVPTSPGKLMLLPVGAGEAKQIPNNGIDQYSSAGWTPDGRLIIFTGNIAGQHERVFAIDAENPGTPRPLTPEGVIMPLSAHTVAPDGKRLAAIQPDGSWALYPINGEGQATRLLGVEPHEFVAGWTSDGGSVYAYKVGIPVNIYKVDVPSGKRTLWKTIGADTSAVRAIEGAIVTPDGKSYAYGYGVVNSELYLMEGAH
jgi:Tol biopolymer transport system component